MAETAGVNHLGLTVRDLDETTDFFTQILGWEEIARDNAYPRTTITDGKLRLTLWQATKDAETVDFDRRSNIGLHHLALTVASEPDLQRLAAVIASCNGVAVEFMPELVGKGPRKHMMFAEPGGIRLELIWSGE
jgi:catechol 2,3-dioxygenase-like lactoylglutathione lyase family enzyme